MAKITDKTGFINYLKRQVSAGWVHIEVEEELYDDIFDDCLEIYYKYSTLMANKRDYIIFDIVAGQGEYDMSSHGIQAVLDLELSSTVSPNTNTLSLEAMWQNVAIDGMLSSSSSFYSYDGGQLQMASYEILNQNTEMMRNKFGTMYVAQYNINTQTMQIFPTPKVSEKVAIEVFKRVNSSSLYNDPNMKELCTARLLYIWGSALIKYNDSLSGGGTTNGQAIRDEGLRRWDLIVAKIDSESTLEHPIIFA